MKSALKLIWQSSGSVLANCIFVTCRQGGNSGQHLAWLATKSVSISISSHFCSTNLCQKFCVPHKIVRSATFLAHSFILCWLPLKLLFWLWLLPCPASCWPRWVELSWVELRLGYVALFLFTSSVNAFRCSFRLTAPALPLSSVLFCFLLSSVVLHFAVAFLIKTFKSASSRRSFGCT